MYDRRKYKKFALKQLEKRWSIPVLMTLTFTLIMMLFQLPNLIRALSSDEFSVLMNTDYESYRELFIAANDFSNSISSSGVSFLLKLIVDSILTFAMLNVYLKMSRSPEKVAFSDFIEGLNYWLKAILTCLWQYLWVFLWSMLFVIPGIVKFISYSQMQYIIMENENVSVTKAMRISMIITNGHKMDLFLTYLSFLGWIILSGLTLGIADLFLEPYIRMTMVNAYHALMKEALETGKILPEDLL